MGIGTAESGRLSGLRQPHSYASSNADAENGISRYNSNHITSLHENLKSKISSSQGPQSVRNGGFSVSSNYGYQLNSDSNGGLNNNLNFRQRIDGSDE